MLILWNKQAQQIFQEFFAKVENTGKIPFHFLLLEGPTHIWKTTLIEKVVQPFLWNYFLTDYLYIPDLSEKLWKKHILKIDSDEIIEIDGKQYYDLWIRQIQDWLQKSSFWKYKVVYLENIERMNIASANAMLKTFEEVLPWRIIIATTSNRSKLLDTIVSRAFIIRFSDLTEKDFGSIWNFLSEEDKDLFAKYKNLILSISWKKPGIVFDLIQKIKEDKQKYLYLLERFEKFVNLYVRWDNMLWEKFNLLKEFYQEWILNQFIDFMVFWFEKKKDFENLNKFLSIKWKIEANLNVENVLFEVAL